MECTLTRFRLTYNPPNPSHMRLILYFHNRKITSLTLLSTFTRHTSTPHLPSSSLLPHFRNTSSPTLLHNTSSPITRYLSSVTTTDTYSSIHLVTTSHISFATHFLLSISQNFFGTSTPDGASPASPAVPSKPLEDIIDEHNITAVSKEVILPLPPFLPQQRE